MNRFALSSSLLLVFLAAHGCVGTPGRAITATLEVELLDLDAATSAGWTVEVERAGLLISAVRVRDALTSAAVARLSAFLLPRAFAHGGHGENDTTVLASWVGAEVLGFGTTHTLPLEGRAGTTDRAALVLGGTLPAEAAELHGHPFWVEGTATRGEVTVPFAGGLDLPASETERLVEGIPLAGDLDDDTLVHLGIDLGVFFDSVHFERLAVRPDGIAPIEAETQAAIALRLGLGDLDAYVGSVAAPPL